MMEVNHSRTRIATFFILRQVCPLGSVLCPAISQFAVIRIRNGVYFLPTIA